MKNLLYHVLLLFIPRYSECKTIFSREGSRPSSTIYEPRYITTDGVSSKSTYYAHYNLPARAVPHPLPSKSFGAKLATDFIEDVIEGANVFSSFGQGLVSGLLRHDLNNYEDESNSIQNNNIFIIINNEIPKSVPVEIIQQLISKILPPSNSSYKMKNGIPRMEILEVHIDVPQEFGENRKPNITKPPEQFFHKIPDENINKDASTGPDQFVENAVINVKHENGTDCVCESERQEDKKKTLFEKVDEAFSFLNKGLEILEEMDIDEEICNLTAENFWKRFSQIACYEMTHNCTEQLEQQKSSQFQELPDQPKRQLEIEKFIIAKKEPIPELPDQNMQQLKMNVKINEHITQKTSTAKLAESSQIKQSGASNVMPISFWSIIATASFLLCTQFLIS